MSNKTNATILSLIVIASTFAVYQLSTLQPAYATVAFDAASNVAAGTGNLSWTHAPSGTPRGIVVIIINNGGTDIQPSVTYGGVPMTQVSGSPNLKTTGEASGVYVFFLGDGIPSGSQTVSATMNSGANRRAAAFSVTASTNTEIVNTNTAIKSDSQSSPSSTLGLSSRTSWVIIGFHSGQPALTDITPLASWTGYLEHDYGAQTAGWYRYDTVASTDVTVGWTQPTADDVNAIAVAVSELQTTASSNRNTGCCIFSIAQLITKEDINTII